MPESAFEGWQELKLASGGGCPKLFYKFITFKDEYSLRITDLMGLWQCSADKEEIQLHAKNHRSSIDPSESSSQLQILLSKLRSSLQHGRNKLTREENDEKQTLTLLTSIDLPHPLKPLQWTFNLQLQKASAMAEHILRPCLHELQTCHQQIESLLRVISDKDHVLSKLLDKFGNSAVDFSLLFPGLTGITSRKGHLKAGDAMKHVPEMAPFDQENWTRQSQNENEAEKQESFGLNNLVRGYEKCFQHTDQEHRDWVHDIPSTTAGGDEASTPTTPSPKASTPAKGSKRKSSTSEDEFERLSSPETRRAKNERSERLEKSRSQTLSPAKRIKISHTNHKPETRPEKSTSGSDQTESSASEHEKAIPSTPSKKIGKLGRLKPSASPSPAKATRSETSSPTKVHKLGRLIAHRPAKLSSVSSNDEEEKSPSHDQKKKNNVDNKNEVVDTPTEKEKQEVESAESKADRRREELKRKLHSDPSPSELPSDQRFKSVQNKNKRRF